MTDHAHNIDMATAQFAYGSAYDSYEHDRGTLIAVANITERAGERRTLTIHRGYSTDLVEQLVEKSRQPHIADELTCPRDATSRFTSPETFEKWLHKGGGRSPYFLTGEAGDLAGIVWFGTEPVPATIAHDPATDPNCTFAVRLYEGYTGKGSARDFIIESLRDYLVQLQEAGTLEQLNGIHLETNVANAGAARLYTSIGWREVCRTDGNSDNPVANRIIMTMDAEAIARICS